ncbi:nuclear distribution protein nudE-like 1 isoform X2 [Portunus trituberculatus]|uniref:nuclear distribution protein nudE-like 1 isoform X2 n=1 Tax=Portunus trituberculatus TaxID=210409 RepID=UPI001E1D05FE|nr:nuclear distribution protein nudE-like 1 isoform X2 [Portunus trituberculatus]
MNGEAVPSFSSPEQEAEYWRKKATEYKQSLEETREELEEFQSGSRELEAELEAQLEQTERRCSEYQAQLNRVAVENDSLKERLERLQNEFNGQVNTLQSELVDLKSIQEDLTRYIRELEQSNDDLERAKRATVTSLEDFEARLNLAIERNAFLESELDEKEDLKVTVQRLKDEARDLRQELSIKDCPEPDNDKALMNHHNHQSTSPQKLHIKTPPKLDVALPASPAGGAGMDSNKLVSNASTLHNNNNSNNMSNGSVPMTPSARISALNIVGDLLRKVGIKIQQINRDLNRVNSVFRAAATTPTITILAPPLPPPRPAPPPASLPHPQGGHQRTQRGAGFPLQQHPPEEPPPQGPPWRLWGGGRVVEGDR